MTWYVSDIDTMKFLGMISAHSYMEAQDKAAAAWPDSRFFHILRA